MTSKKYYGVLMIMICLALTAMGSRTDQLKKISVSGFLVFDNPDFCFLLELKDSTRCLCFEKLTRGTKGTAIRIPGSWVNDLSKVLTSIDTVRRTDVPEGFVEDLYDVHYVPVTVTFTMGTRVEEKIAHKFRFKNGSLAFHSRQWASEILDLKLADFCK